jgi:hypothetical protein
MTPEQARKIVLETLAEEMAALIMRPIIHDLIQVYLPRQELLRTLRQRLSYLENYKMSHSPWQRLDVIQRYAKENR